MPQFTPYILTTLLSSVVILIIGVCLLLVSVPREPALRNYRISRRFLAGAYIALAAVGQWEVWGGIESDGDAVVMAFTLIAASVQALLFTFTIITLINVRCMTTRKAAANVIPILTVSGALLAVLFAAPQRVFYAVFYAAFALYCLQLVYYIVVFGREYGRYHRRFDNFFAGDEYHRARWIRASFYMAAGVGVTAVASLFVSTEVYMVFTAAYTLFYVYFAVKFTNYITLFHRIAPVVVKTQDEVPAEKEITSEKIRPVLEKWMNEKGFLSPDVSLESLAREFYINPTYLSRYINSTFGQNFRSWINSQRIAEAQRLITERADLSFAQIGELVGIPSSSTFYRQFAAATGVTPAEYRRRFEQGKA